MRLLATIVMKIWGFTVTGPNPAKTEKYIMVAAPHTSNWDFLVGILCKFMWKIPVNYLAKKSLFRPPIGFIFRATGGVPVDRSSSHNMVEALTRIFKEESQFALCIAPEGTRSLSDSLKTGFYHIAKAARVPLIFCRIDYGSKIVRFSEPQEIVNLELDAVLQMVKDYFKGAKGLNNDQNFFNQ